MTDTPADTPSATFFARSVDIRLAPDTLDAAMVYYRAVSVPLVLRQQGAVTIVGLGDAESGHGCAISFWETLADLERSAFNPDVVAELMHYSQWMVGPFNVESFAVTRGALPPTGPDADEDQLVLLTALPLDERERDEVIAPLAARLARVQSLPGCRAALLLEPLVGNRVIALELWASRDALAEAEGATQAEDRAIWRVATLERPPVRETLRVFGRYDAG